LPVAAIFRSGGPIHKADSAGRVLLPLLACVVRVAFSGDALALAPDLTCALLSDARSRSPSSPARPIAAGRADHARSTDRSDASREVAFCSLQRLPAAPCRPEFPGSGPSRFGVGATSDTHVPSRSPSPLRFFVRLARLRCFRVEWMETRRPRHVIRGCRSFQRTYRTADRGPFSRLGREGFTFPATLMGLSWPFAVLLRVRAGEGALWSAPVAPTCRFARETFRASFIVALPAPSNWRWRGFRGPRLLGFGPGGRAVPCFPSAPL
jgi:hypothetical protein